MSTNSRYTALVFAALMSLVMAGVVKRWLSSYIVAWPVAFTVLLSLRSRVARIAARLTGDN